MLFGSMGRSLLPHPRPVGRKTSQLDGYYKNGVPVSSATIGDTITYDVPGHSPGTVYLVQTVNGQPGYAGPFSVPMAPFQLGPGQPVGQWLNTVYDKQGGNVIETDSLMVLGQTVNQTQNSATPPTKCPDGYTYYGPYTDPAGNPQPGGCAVTQQTQGTTTSATQTTTGSGGGSNTGGGGSTSTTTSATTTTGATDGGGGSAPNDTLLIAAVVALAFVLLK